MISLKLSKRERYIFIATVSIIAIAILYNFIIGPLFQKWSRLNDEISIKRARLKKGMRLLQDQDSIISEYTSYAVSVKNASKALSYIEKKAISLGIKTANVRPMPVARKDLYSEYIIELQVEGNLKDINNFISQLINPPTVITVKKFDFRSKEESASTVKGTLILSRLAI